MHFLAHFYTELPNENPLFVAALSIPDLTPHFTRIYNSQLKNILMVPQRLQPIHDGIVQHYAGDKWFHSGLLFQQNCKAAIDFFVEEKLNRKKMRLSFIAHLAVELMIDRQIILQQEGLGEQYYKLLEEADEKLIREYFTLHSMAVAEENFFSTFQFFKQKRILFLFKDLENIVIGLNRIYSGVTKINFTEEEKRKFLSALHNIDFTLRYSWQEILKNKS